MRVKTLPFPLPAIPPKFTAADAYEQNNRLSRKLFSDFFKWPIEKSQRILARTTAEEWEKAGQRRALEVFHAAAERVPAYKDFLKKQDIHHEKIRTAEDFRKVPTTDKNNYLRAYPLEKLCWDGNFTRSQIISVSSGSTGKPFLWPRDVGLEIETTFFFELAMESFFHISKYRTLVVDCFAMGMYVGGPFFLNATLRVAQKGYPIAVATPGNNLDDVLRVLKELAPFFEQVVLSGYPPFLKDAIEQGYHVGIDWSQMRTILFPAGEGFSESWRSYVSQLLHQPDSHTDLLSYYGTADAAVLGVETPWSVAVREMIAGDNGMVKKIFGESRLPSFLQYFPTLRYFEAVNAELHFTAPNGVIPLVRYNIHDKGGLLSHREVSQIGTAHDRLKNSWQLPFVYVFGRSDHTAIIYGANVYPENMRSVLEQPGLSQQCTGRFMMVTEEGQSHDQQFKVHVECKPEVALTTQLQQEIETLAVKVLTDLNAEYANALKANGPRALPQVILHPFGDDQYFPRNKQKQRWEKGHAPGSS